MLANLRMCLRVSAVVAKQQQQRAFAGVRRQAPKEYYSGGRLALSGGSVISAAALAASLSWGKSGLLAEVSGDGADFPIDLVIVRHGQSEANIMIEMKNKGDMSGQVKMDEVNRHDSMMRLTDLGRSQARNVGKWISANIGQFDRFYVSQYVRTKETAAELGLSNAQWQASMMIRERDQGVQDGQGDVKMGLDEDEKHRVQKSPMYWAPMAGESMCDVCLRVSLFLRRLQHTATGMKVIVVCHYRTIHAFRLLVEDTSQAEYERLLSEKMPNCCIWWYSRRCEAGHIHSHIVQCKRIEVSADGSSAKVIAFPVNPKPFTNQMLLDEVARTHQVLNNPK